MKMKEAVKHEGMHWERMVASTSRNGPPEPKSPRQEQESSQLQPQQQQQPQQQPQQESVQQQQVPVNTDLQQVTLQRGVQPTDQLPDALEQWDQQQLERVNQHHNSPQQDSPGSIESSASYSDPESPWQQKSMQLQQQVPVNTGLQEVVTLQVGVQPTDQLQASVAGVGQSTTFQEESQSNNLTTKPLTWPQQQEWLDQILPPVVPFEPLTSMSDTLLKAEAMGNADKHALWQEQELQPLPDTYEDAIKQLGHGPVNMGANQQQEFALQGQPEAIQQEMQQQLLQQQQQCFKLQAVNMQVPNQTQPAKIAPAPLAPSSSSITGGLPGYYPPVPDSPIFSIGVSASLPGPEKKREMKKIKEQERRRDIKSECNELQKLLPSASREADVSMKVLLKEGIEHIKKKDSETAELKEDKYLLQQKVTSLQESIDVYRNLLQL